MTPSLSLQIATPSVQPKMSDGAEVLGGWTFTWRRQVEVASGEVRTYLVQHWGGMVKRLKSTWSRHGAPWSRGDKRRHHVSAPLFVLFGIEEAVHRERNHSSIT